MAIQRSPIASFLSCFIIALAVITTVTADLDDLAKARQNAKPWLNKSIRVQNVNLFVTPATLIVILAAFFYLYYAVVLITPKPAQVIASHILLSDHSDKTRDKLVAIKGKIGTDYHKFSKMAAQISECPSKSNGGTLGRFKQGVMVPPFDRLVFDEATPVQSAVGPIQTQFGWHLIYIQDRFIPKKKQ